MENINQILLIGLMGSGKSSTGKALSDSLNWTFYDIDNELELLFAEMLIEKRIIK